MVSEAARSGRCLPVLFCLGEPELEPDVLALLKRQGTALYQVSENVLTAVCDTQSPQPMVASCEMAPPAKKLEDCRSCILLDGIQDPGNMGTILRTADAMGIDLVVAAGCVELYNPKVVRSTMGSLFRQPVLVADGPQGVLEEMSRQGWNILASVLDDTARSAGETDFSGRVCVIIGNEAHGVSPLAVEKSTGRVYIPMSGGAESLNAGVAAGILMWEMAKACKK